MIVANKKFSKNKLCIGSALILAVVLTSLLAIVGVMFLMTARVDRMATSAVSQQKELNLAVDTIIAKISGELALDVPFIDDANGVERSEYYDYPDPCNAWLASLEPYESGGNYYWRHISDIYNKFKPQDLWDLQARIIYDYQKATFVNDSNIAALYPADADGDGVSDSAWVKLDSMNSGKGRPIYAAIRIIDNCGMLNINTALMFDPTEPLERIDGSSQLQINLAGLSQRGANGMPVTAAGKLQAWRCGAMPPDLALYERNVIWRYGTSDGPYIPFDISDELKLRNRYILNYNRITTRIEELWTKAYDGGLEVPRTDPCEISDPNFWFWRTNYNCQDPNYDYDKYDFRHISTTCSMDRVIDPNGTKMVPVNAAATAGWTSPEDIFYAVRTGAPGLSWTQAAQLAVNIKDFSDSDLDVTRFNSPIGPYYGIEPQPFISEIGFKISDTNPANSANNSFAVELYNPFDVNIPLGGFRLELRRGADVNTVNLASSSFITANGRFVITNSGYASNEFGVTGLTPHLEEDPNLVLATYRPMGTDPETYSLRERYDIYLLRTTAVEPNLYLDKQETRDGWFNWDSIKDTQKFYCRPDNNWNVVYQDIVFDVNNTLGKDNNPDGTRKNYNIPSFADGLLTVGDITRVLAVGPSTNPDETIGEQLATEPPESNVRIDLQQPAFANIFQYLTVIDPATHNNPSSETRVKGRININTAPWFVIAQLPWVNYELAQAIVAYRDRQRYLTGGVGVDYFRGGLPQSRSIGMAATSLIRPAVREELGFASVGELFNVTQDVNEPWYSDLFDIRRHGKDKPPTDLSVFPDLTPGDGAANDFEEQDVIFSRVSNLATVRSDVFTAYILVRIGADGPQKRVIAILDRSDVRPIDGYPFTSGEVKVRALHPVPDPW